MAEAGSESRMFEDPKEVRARIKQERKELRKQQKELRKDVKRKEQEFADREAELDMQGGGFISFMLTMLIILMWLVIMALLVKLDVGGFGSGVLAPILKDVPYLNRILPDSVRVDTGTDVADGPATDISDPNGYIRRLENQLQQSQTQNQRDAETIQQLQAEIERLRSFEEQQRAFLEQRDQFYDDIVYNDNAPDAAQYAAYYEMIDPARAAELYRQIMQADASLEKVQEYARAYSSMKPKEAAAIFDDMVQNGTEHMVQLAARILLQMTPDDRGKILGKMDPANASILTNIMEPNDLPYPDSATVRVGTGTTTPATANETAGTGTAGTTDNTTGNTAGNTDNTAADAAGSDNSAAEGASTGN